jgi:hypothetical protein
MDTVQKHIYSNIYCCMRWGALKKAVSLRQWSTFSDPEKGPFFKQVYSWWIQVKLMLWLVDSCLQRPGYCSQSLLMLGNLLRLYLLACASGSWVTAFGVGWRHWYFRVSFLHSHSHTYPRYKSEVLLLDPAYSVHARSASGASYSFRISS